MSMQMYMNIILLCKQTSSNDLRAVGDVVRLLEEEIELFMWLMLVH